MSDDRHSPAPWTAETCFTAPKQDTEPCYRITDATGKEIARVAAAWSREGECNALAILALPEMLALLREEPKTRCDDRGTPICPDVAKGFPPCWRHRLDTLLAGIDKKTP